MNNHPTNSVLDTGSLEQIVVHAADFSATYGGNFTASLRALATAGHENGKELVLAFPESAVSEYIRQRTIAFGTSKERIRVVRIGIDQERASATSLTPTEVRRRFAIPQDADLVLLFGWEPTVKGVDTALEAVASPVTLIPSVVLVVVGTERLKDFISQRLAGDYPSWLRVLPPTETAALKTPVAVFFQADNAEGLAWAIREVMSWTDIQRGMFGKSNQVLAGAEYGIAGWVEHIRSFYDAILSGDQCHARRQIAKMGGGERELALAL